LVEYLSKKVLESVFIYLNQLHYKMMNMNFIKHYLGLKLLICLFLPSISCKKEEVFKENYRIGFENKYFERIDSVMIGDKIMRAPIEVSTIQNFEDIFPIGTYKIQIYTASNLVIKTTLKAVSYDEYILLVLTEKGDVLIKK